MDNIKGNEYYIEKIRTDIEFVLRYVETIEYDEFVANEILIDSVLFRLSQITENVGKLSNDYKEKHSDIPWSTIRGIRNRIIHDYGAVDLKVIFETAKYDLPDLLKNLSSNS